MKRMGMNTMKTNIKKLLLTLVSAGLMVGATAANASTIMDDWKLDLSVVNGTGGLISHIDHLNLSGGSTIVQNVAGGTALGQTFTDSGYLQFTQYVKETGFGSPGFLTIPKLGKNGSGDFYQSMYLTFSGLTGVLKNDGTVKFDAGSGTVKLWLDTDDNLDASDNAKAIAEFQVVAPSGGSDLNFFGGGGANATIDVTLKMLSSVAGLFKNSLGVSIDPNWTLELINTGSLLTSQIANVNQFGNGSTTLTVNNGGQFNLSTQPKVVPEPATLALAGIGLLGLFGMMRRKVS